MFHTAMLLFMALFMLAYCRPALARTDVRYQSAIYYPCSCWHFWLSDRSLAMWRIYFQRPSTQWSALLYIHRYCPGMRCRESSRWIVSDENRIEPWILDCSIRERYSWYYWQSWRNPVFEYTWIFGSAGWFSRNLCWAAGALKIYDHTGTQNLGKMDVEQESPWFPNLPNIIAGSAPPTTSKKSFQSVVYILIRSKFKANMYHMQRHASLLFLYSSSLTASCHTVSPKPTTKCVINEPSSAPCQCVVPAGAQTVSPALILRASLPLSQIQPDPERTRITCPPSWVCQCVRAQGVNVTFAITTDVSRLIGSTYTSPVKVAVGFAMVWLVTVEPRMMTPSGMMTMYMDTEFEVVDVLLR